MVTYAYRCTSPDCGQTTEVAAAMGQATTPTCACGADTRRVFSLGGVTFKGNGFYRTDSRSGRG